MRLLREAVQTLEEKWKSSPRCWNWSGYRFNGTQLLGHNNLELCIILIKQILVFIFITVCHNPQAISFILAGASLFIIELQGKARQDNPFWNLSIKESVQFQSRTSNLPPVAGLKPLSDQSPSTSGVHLDSPKHLALVMLYVINAHL